MQRYRNHAFASCFATSRQAAKGTWGVFWSTRNAKNSRIFKTVLICIQICTVGAVGSTNWWQSQTLARIQVEAVWLPWNSQLLALWSNLLYWIYSHFGLKEKCGLQLWHQILAAQRWSFPWSKWTWTFPSCWTRLTTRTSIATTSMNTGEWPFRVRWCLHYRLAAQWRSSSVEPVCYLVGHQLGGQPIKTI